ncbi:hypothetical protein [Ketobacter sp.]|uniref:hypothetical protein n=1 Tax=Ketobacter sp. TaxID=2083498 RepID=UPI000F168ED3|nr:hypothetical protein [Ketobacter sp.]RLT94484.1 MAG: hypothetical protein D9N14_16670 [Ketobacter sp.]
MNKLVSIRSFLVVILGLVSTLSSARTISDLDAVHKAAEQRTLVMRIARDHVQMAANVDYQAAKADLESSLEAFELLLGQLEHNSPNSTINQRVMDIKQQWLSFRSTALASPDADSVLTLIEESNELLLSTDILMRDWQARLPHHYGHRIDLAQQQSMLSERINLLYLAKYIDVNADWIEEEMGHTVAAYEAGMAELRMDSQDAAVDPLIVSQLSSNWEYAKLGLEQFSNGKYVPVVMSVTLTSMIQQTNTLADAYHIRDRIAMNGGRVLAESSLAANIAH